MQHVPAWQALTTFGEGTHRSYACVTAPPSARDSEFTIAPLLAEARAEAYQRGRADGEAELNQKLQAAREEIRRSCAEELASLVDVKAREFDALALKVDGAIAAIASSLSGKVAAILTPVLNQAASRQATNELVEIIRSFREGGNGGVIRIVGPSRLVEALGVKGQDNFCIIENEELSNIVVETDETRIEWELSRWQACLLDKLI